MSNPYMVQIPFCNTGNKNAIQLTQQVGQDPEDATYQEGFPPVTMLNEDAGGLPPKGLDFNGIFYELSSPIAHYCRGDRIQFDATYASAIGGYAKGWIVASNDYQKDYISLVDNNLADPNGTNTTWAVYAGQGSVPTATSTTTGTVKLVNSLASMATDAALTAAQGRLLNDKFNFQNLKSPNGYISLGDSGLILQWGIGTGGNNYQVNFPTEFPNACLNVSINDRDGQNSHGYNYATMTRFKFNIYTTGTLSFSWFAIGY